MGTLSSKIDLVLSEGQDPLNKYRVMSSCHSCPVVLIIIYIYIFLHMIKINVWWHIFWCILHDKWRWTVLSDISVSIMSSYELDNVNWYFYCSACTKSGKWAIMYVCVRGVIVSSFYDFDIWFWNSSDWEILFVFSSYCYVSVKVDENSLQNISKTKMKQKKYCTVGTVPKSNWKIIIRGQIVTSNPQMHECNVLSVVITNRLLFGYITKMWLTKIKVITIKSQRYI
jgi:hypothetical protein